MTADVLGVGDVNSAVHSWPCVYAAWALDSEVLAFEVLFTLVFVVIPLRRAVRMRVID